MSIFARIADIMTDERSLWAFSVGAAIAPLVGLLENYVFGDLRTVWFLLLLVGLDTALGFRLAWRQRNLSSLAFARVLDKILVYLCLLAASYAVARMGGATVDSWMFIGLRWLVVSYILVREFLSIIEKAERMGYGLPEWITRPLRDYVDRGDASRKSNVPKKPEKHG